MKITLPNNITVDLTEEQKLELIKQLTKAPHWTDKCVDPIEEDFYYIANDDEGPLSSLSCTRGVDYMLPKYAFKTDKHAKLVARKANLLIEMSNFCEIVNEGWLPWADGDNLTNFGLIIDETGVRVNYNNQHNPFIFGLAVKSQELAELMLAEFGEEIKSIYRKQF